jgi:hypothetical protein
MGTTILFRWNNKPHRKRLNNKQEYTFFVGKHETDTNTLGPGKHS